MSNIILLCRNNTLFPEGRDVARPTTADLATSPSNIVAEVEVNSPPSPFPP